MRGIVFANHDIKKLSAIPPLTLDGVPSGTNLHSAYRLTWTILVASLGILGVSRSWLPDCGLPSADYFAVLFGLTLQGLVILHFKRQLQFKPLLSAMYVYDCCRQNSRAVYALLFSLVGLHQIGALLSGVSVSGTAGELKGYFLGGVGALVVIRCIGVAWLR